MIGQTVSHYRILEELGAGGMGRVYKAEDTRLKQPVALKFLPPELTSDREAKKRFVNEVRSVFGLEHQNICNIHELNETQDGQMYVCMAYYEGKSLRERLAEEPMPIDEAIETVCRVAQGLESAHNHGIVHRDIKPGNIMITKDGDVKIVDFGIAKLKDTTRFTTTGKTVGTLAYMSPEQARGQEVDARSDIFSLGVVLYELLAGRPAFTADYEEAVVYQIVHEDPAPLSGFRDDVSEGLKKVIQKSLQKNPDKRYQTATALREDIESLLKGKEPLRRHLARNLVIAAALAAVAVLLWQAPLVRVWYQRILGGQSPAVQYLAVLPFNNVGGDPANQAFCDGLMETLTSKLGELQRFHALWVIPASDVHKEGITSAREASRVFGVNLVITGSVQRFPDGFRLTLNLIDVEKKTPRQLSSFIIDDRVANLALLQDNSVLKMASMLNVELLPDTQVELAAGGTSVSQAYDFYVQGLGYLQRYEDNEKIDLAIRYFNRAADEDALYALAYSGLGEAYLRKYSNTKDPKWMEPAIKNSMRAVVLNDRLAPVHVTLGLVYRRTGRYEESITVFQRALAIDSLNAEAYRGLAGAYAEVGRLEEAESTYEIAIELKPEFWGGYNDLALFYYSKARYEDAIPHFRKITELTPDNTYGYNNMGACYYYLGRLDKAAELFEKSIEARPEHRAYSNLGAIYYIDGRYEDSAEAVEKALEINDASYATWTNLGNACYWIPDRREEAIEVFRRCAQMAERTREINPRDEYVLVDLAAFYAMTGEDDLARPLIDRALAIAVDDINIMYQAGHAYEQLGDREEALEWVGKAVTGGYPVTEIQGDPFMRDLTADERFLQLTKSGAD